MTQSRLVLIPAFIVVAAVGILGLAAAVGGLGMAACAAPPPGWHQVTTLEDFGWLVPPLVVAFVGEYFALAARRVSVRVLASALVLIATFAVTLYSLAAVAFSCGHYAP